MAVDIIARGMAANASGGGSSDYDSLTNKPSINGTELSGNKTSADLGLDSSILITAESNTTVNGYQVPSLTSEQIIEIYNGIVAGKEVVVVDATETMHFKVNQADSMSDEIFISFLYFDIMILQYDENENITHKEIASKSYVDSQIGNAIEGSY